MEKGPRIDLTQSKINPIVAAELKRCYEEIDKLRKALSILNSTHFPKWGGIRWRECSYAKNVVITDWQL